MMLIGLYRNSMLYSAIINLVGSIAFTVWENRNYTSEWLTSNGILPFVFITDIIFTVFFAIISSPIFLNTYNIIRNNMILSLLSWFLLPVTFTGVLLGYGVKHTMLSGEKDLNYLVYLLILTLPFLGGLIWSFTVYRRQLARE